MRILLVDDDAGAASVLERSLRREGFVVDVLHDAAEATLRVDENEYDAILLEGFLSGKTGLELCREARARGVRAPILMMSERASVLDRVTGLDSGADDYLMKPFAFQELLARIRALLRRASGNHSPILQVADLSFDPASRIVRRGERRILLTAKEEAIFEFLLRRSGEVVTRARLSDHVWPEERDNLTNLVDVHMSKLRRKVDGASEVPLIHTVRGRGFRVGIDVELRSVVGH